MNSRRCLRIAERINAQIVAELGVTVDPQRLLDDPLYARDVLLVCDAHRQSGLAELSQHFRAALAEEAEPIDSGSAAAPRPSSIEAAAARAAAASTQASDWGGASSRYETSPHTAPSDFELQRSAARAARAKAAWWSPTRWRGGEK